MSLGKLVQIDQDGVCQDVCDIVVFTNLDSKYGHWEFPKIFHAIPEVCDYINSNERRLKVCSRTFGLNGEIEIEVTGSSSHS